ncbi:Mitochondrial carrier protein family protein [Cryptosporidium meleagridis]|uniref:Mitochondrial carrier protein family protein n=1 Tax=Cryptosporidium meleagridis TaxID=93969 RepID=A0A2P4YVX9_9CRYT|nr:Mitochondrial carrier protein family protein [Cryptosporidium meleagridis]
MILLEEGLVRRWFEVLRPFISGGISGCIATICVQPIDLVKIQMQLQNFEGYSKSTPFSVARDIIDKNGFLGLYKGLDAGLIRQLTYSTSRLGIFRLLCDYNKNQMVHQGHQVFNLSLGVKALIGLTSGGISSFICNPVDLALIRLQTNSLLPLSQQKCYKNVLQAIKCIIKEEGFFSMWKGSVPSIVRAMSINMGMLATYDHFIEVCCRWTGPNENQVFVKVLSSILSGAVASVVSLPFDTIKTQIQKQTVYEEDSESLITKQEGHNLNNYTRVIAHIYRSQGLSGFFKGYLTYYSRIAPHAMITLLCMDWFNKKF